MQFSDVSSLEETGRHIPLDRLQHSTCENPRWEISEVYPQHTKPNQLLRRQVFNGSSVASCLGFYEPTSVRILGLPSYRVDPAAPEKCRKVFLHNRCPEIMPHPDYDAVAKDGDDVSAHVIREIGNTHRHKSVALKNETDKNSERDAMIREVYMSWGRNHEMNALRDFLIHFDSLGVKECGLYSRDVEGVEWKMGAMPDGIIYPANGNEDGDGDDDSAMIEPIGVLEIKCPTPFIYSYDRGEFMFVKRKPFDRIPVYYMPQLQMEMAMTGLDQCIFVSWTPERGMTVFHVDYDPLYFEDMIRFENTFYERYVKPVVSWYDSGNCGSERCHVPEIPHDYLLGEEGYEKFLERTVRICQDNEPLSVLPSIVKSDTYWTLFLREK